MAYENVTLKVDSAVADIIRNAGMSMQEAFEMFCRDLAASGRLPKKEEVKRPKALDEMSNEELRSRIMESVEQMKRGEGQPIDEAFAEIRRSIGI